MEIVGICSQEHVATGTHGERTGQTRKKVTLKRYNDKGNKFKQPCSLPHYDCKIMQLTLVNSD